jgi:Flp pilus assembly protein TadG
MTVYRRTREIELGQSMVEFAISAIVIILLLVAVADFGRAFFTYLSMRDAAQEGALYGAICPMHVVGIEARVRSTGNLPVNLADATQVNIECEYRHDINANGVFDTGEVWDCNSGSVPLPGYGINILVEYPQFVVTTPLLGSIIGNTISLRAEVTDTILQVPDPGSACP